jgi:DNA-directed RNA polymerase specialized sigma subunit
VTVTGMNPKLTDELVAARQAVIDATTDRARTRAERRLDDAIVAIQQANIALARSYAGKFDRSPFAEDIAAAAEIALWQAVTTWDPSRGALSTWAYPQIKKAVITEAARMDRGANRYTFGARRHVRDAEDELRTSLGRVPSDAEIAHATDLPVGLVSDIRLAERRGPVQSLDAPLSADGGVVADLVADAGLLADDTADAHDPVHAIRSAARDMPIVALWCGLRSYGLQSAPAESTADIAADLGVSRETVRVAVRRFDRAIADALAR